MTKQGIGALMAFTPFLAAMAYVTYLAPTIVLVVLLGVLAVVAWYGIALHLLFE
jgi:hypothetical protein